MRVIGLGRYPVKSFQGETLDAAEIDMAGLAGDRRWALVDQDSGKVLSAKREARLLHGAATTNTTGGVDIKLPDGTSGQAGDRALDEAARRWLERDVRFEQPDPAVARSYELNVNSEDESSALTEFGCPPGTFLDIAAVHVLTTASLRAAAARYPEGRWELPRFRPTIVVDGPGDEFIEDGWVGRAVRVGTVVLTPFMPTVRCTMITRAQLDLPRDLDIAKTVNREHGGSLGVYCAVAEPGRVAVGDDLTVE
jgi:uncharacterized protein YcbX